MLKKTNQSIFFLFLIFIFFCFIFFAPNIFAQNQTSLNISASSTLSYYIKIDNKTAQKGYTILYKDFKLSLGTTSLSDASEIKVEEIAGQMPIPWQLNQISRVYQFEIINKSVFTSKNPLYLELKYNKPSDYFKQIYFFDRGTWRALPGSDYPDKKIVRSPIHLPFFRAVILENTRLMTMGQASWYAYKKGLFAASPDFPAGARLRVYNSALGRQKFVDVTINDYGPNRLVHPGRVIDLDKVAFSKLAATSQGTMAVLVEPLFLPPGFKTMQNLGDIKAETNPQVSAKSAYLLSDNKNNVIYEKNSKAVLPLASLTKIISAKVFSDTKPDLNKIVAYSIADEEKNYLYCKKWESAKLKLADGDKIKINDLLIASLSASTNNTVETLVRASGLSRPAFIAKMNDLANASGATSTVFIEPSGLSPKNVSSAFEYAIIFREAIKNIIISESTAKFSYKININNGKNKITIFNTDRIIGLNKYRIIASKTGYLDEVGYNLAIKAEQNGRKLILVLMGAPTREQSIQDALNLLEFGFKNKF